MKKLIGWIGKAFFCESGYKEELHYAMDKIKDEILITNKILKRIAYILITIAILIMMVASCGAATYTVTDKGDILISQEAIPLLSWDRHTGKAGLDLMKQENGAWLQTIYVQGQYRVDKRFTIDYRYSENFSITRGASPFRIGNHHSFQYRLGLNFKPFANGMTIYTAWDNRCLIPEHDNIFVEEYAQNRNLFGCYYEW